VLNQICNMNDPLENAGQNLTLRASGKFLGNTWEFRGDIIGDSAHEWISFMGPDYYAAGGSSGDPLPFADIGWKRFGHIGSYGWSGCLLRRWFRLIREPGSINGVVSKDVAKVLIFFKNGISEEALMIESGHPDVQFFFLPYNPTDVQFFFLPYHPKAEWTELVALDAQGRELDRALPW
jgi:hypothetical protein